MGKADLNKNIQECERDTFQNRGRNKAELVITESGRYLKLLAL